MKLNWRIIGSIIGILLMFNGGFMLLCIIVSIFYWESDWLSLFLAGGITSLCGFALWFLNKNAPDKELRKRDGYIIVTIGWLSMSIFGALPYLFSGAIPAYTNAFFETISGFTTTGASILNDIESLPKGILFWRSLTQWIGGMGIIVLAVAILPILGIGGTQLFGAEAPGITPDKLKPRMRETAKRLWLIYLGLTVAETLLLFIGGMDFFDAINHALTTMATGGFSTKQDSIAYFQSPFIQYVLIFFMFLAGTNFTMTYFALKGQFRTIIKNEEFRFYVLMITFFAVVIPWAVYAVSDHDFERAFRDSLFQIVSVITTTGFVSADYTAWTPLLTLVFLLLMFYGGSAGSTAGGVKLVRHLILLKNSFLELKRQLHPSAVLPVRYNGKAVSQDITFNVLAFIFIYIFIFGLGSVVMTLFGLDFMTAIGSVATSLGNVGPGLGTVGPVDNFAHIPMPGKWFLAFLMLLGRLELFTVLILFTPAFWTKH